MTVRALVLAAVFSVSALPRPALATEFDLTAYLADPAAIAGAIGSGDPALRADLLGQADYVAEQGLEQRFVDPQTWRRGVRQLVAGEPRESIAINGFVIEMLLRSRGAPAASHYIGMPFADLQIVSGYLGGMGEAHLAAFLDAVARGNSVDGGQGLPASLAGRLGGTEYYARVSAFDAPEAAALLELMPRLRQAIAHLQAMDGRAEDAIADAERRKWTARYSEKGDRAADGGRTVEQEVARRVARTLDDPYRYVDNVGAVDYDLETLSGWLRQASLSGKALFLVYKEY